MTNRTKRLSRLGNAVVPEIEEWIGHRLMQFAIEELGLSSKTEARLLELGHNNVRMERTMQ